MLNQLVLIGRLVDKPIVKETKDSRKVSYIKIAVPRNYKDVNSEYINDIIPITLYNGVAQNCESYCNKGNLLGVKGRIECIDDTVVIIAEKITFLSSKNEQE